jgi:prepilin signal peptidase PulO-like enzyme (type II secretory pathway)
MPLDIIFVAGLGVILGSFLNALLFRFNTGKSVLHGRSACMRCAHTLSASDLVPLFSFVFLGGRCRYCRTKISWQYPTVEALAGLLAVLVYLQTGPTVWLVYWLAVWMMLLFVVVYDLRHFIIPWSASLLLMALALAGVLLSLAGQPGGAEGEWWTGPALAAPLLLISFVSRGQWMGWGDGILELSLGWLLGISMGLTAFLVAFWAGATVGILLLLIAKNRYTMRSEVPFAPFLILGCAVAYFLHVDLFPNLSLLF